MELKTQEQIAVSYLEKMKRNFSEEKAKNADAAIKTIKNSGDLKNFSTIEKSIKETKKYNSNIGESKIKEIASIIHVIYNNLNRTAEYSKEVKETLRKMRIGKPYELRKSAYRDYK